MNRSSIVILAIREPPRQSYDNFKPFKTFGVNRGGLCTPYNRLLRRQITALTTDQGKFFGKGVGEVFLFAKINKQICGLQLMIENIFNVWRYCSSNLTLFQVKISFCQLVKTCVSKIFA